MPNLTDLPLDLIANFHLWLEDIADKQIFEKVMLAGHPTLTQLGGLEDNSIKAHRSSTVFWKMAPNFNND